MRWWRVALVTLGLVLGGLGRVAGAQPPSGALAPIEPTALTLEHVVVRLQASPSGARVQLDTTLVNPVREQAEGAFMLLMAPGLQVERDGSPVELEPVKTREHEVGTFLVRLDPGQRTHLTARWRLAGRAWKVKLPEGYQSATLLVQARQGWRLSVSPQVVPVSQTLDEVIYGVSLGPDQVPWLEVDLAYRGLPVWIWLLGVPILASLAAGALAQAWPGPPAGRAVLLAYLMNGPVYLWLVGEGYTAWHPGPLPLFICFAAGPIVAAVYSVAGFPRRGILAGEGEPPGP